MEPIREGNQALRAMVLVVVLAAKVAVAAVLVGLLLAGVFGGLLPPEKSLFIRVRGLARRGGA